MFEITLTEITKLRDEILLRPDDEDVVKKCEQFASDYAGGLREVENSERAKNALWNLFNAMPRVKGKLASLRLMKMKYAELFENTDIKHSSTNVTAAILLSPKTTRVVVELYARKFVNGSKSVREYNFAEVKDPERVCVFTHKETDSFWVKEYDKSGKLLANTVRRPDRNTIHMIGSVIKKNGGR